MNVICSFEYMVPEFADIEITNVSNIEEGKELAMKEFVGLYPEAIDPVIVSAAMING